MEYFIHSHDKVICGIFVYIFNKSWKYCIHYLQTQARRYIIIRKRLFGNFIKISCILADRCTIKSNGNLKIFIYIRYLGVYSFLAQALAIITKIFSQNLNTGTHRVPDVFGKNQAYAQDFTYFVFR